MSRFKQYQTAHSHPQSLDTGSTPKAFCDRAIELGAPGLTVTDHGSLAACRAVYDLAKKAKLIPILGLEAYFRDDNCPIMGAAGIPKNADGKYVDYLKYGHVTMHALDASAYGAMVRLLSKADERAEKHGSERKPLFDWANLEELGSYNITMTTGCLIGIVPRLLLDHNDLKMAEQYFSKLKSIVKPGNLYVEMFPHDCSKNWVEGVFITLADGSTNRFYAKKNLMTNIGEIQASNLARSWASPDNKHLVLRSVKDRTTWREMAEQAIVKVEHIEGFLPNECRPWAQDGDLQAGLNRAMRFLAKKHDCKILIGDDSHYAKADEKVVQDVRLAQSGSWRFYGAYHMMSSDEAFPHFQKIGVKEPEFEGWIENGAEWTNRFKDFVFDSQPSLPTKFYEPKYEAYSWFKPDGKDNSLRYVMELIKKHGRMDWSNKQYTERLRAEINLLHNNGTIDLIPYFFIDEEACSIYEAKGLLTGPGRGSAAGILLTYLLGITHVDPLKYDLSMERFLTLDRVQSGKLPDIDQDLPHRDLLINPEDPTKGWLPERFGEHYSQISVDSTLKLKMAVKDVSRSQRGEVPPEIEIFTKKFIMPPMGMTDFDFVLGHETDGEGWVQGSVEYDPALRDYIKFTNALCAHEKAEQTDWEIVQKCLGLARQKGRHACAFIIANRPIHEFIPMTTVSDVRVTAYNAKAVEAVGGLKMDFLVVNSLNDIGDCIKLVQGRHEGKLTFTDTTLDGKRVPSCRLVPMHDKLMDVWDLPEDQDVFTDIVTGKTEETVFQFSTEGVQQWMKQFAHRKANGNFAIDSIEGLSALTALDRPGPLNMFVANPDEGGQHNLLVEYARRARGETPSPGILKVFDDLIPETFGVMVYQEQLQKMYQQLTGCSLTEAESFRNDVSKKLKSEIDKAYTPFIERAGAKIGEEEAKAAWQFFLTWAEYGFNKSHAVCYSVIGYACAYLKHYYPLEWWTAVLRNASKHDISEKFWRHCGHLIDLPDIKLSGNNFEIQNERIRAPLNLLMGVGESAHKQISASAPYTDIFDFCKKIEVYREETGAWSVKPKVIKDTKNKVVDPETGRKVSPEITVQVNHLKKGYSALNRGIVTKMILAGTMDALFPEGLHVGEQLQMYEQAVSDAANESLQRLHPRTNDPKPPKQVKVEAVDDKVWNIGPIRRYQTKKAILPTFGTDLRELVLAQKVQGLSPGSSEGEVPVYYWTNQHTGNVDAIGVGTASDIEELNRVQVQAGGAIQVAVVAYVEAWRCFNYGEDRRQACELQLEINSARFKFVRWGGKNKLPEIYKQDLTGAVIIAILNKWSNDRPFSFDDVIVVQSPIDANQPEPEKADSL